MTNVATYTVRHKLPDTFSVHTNSIWKALKSVRADPYLLTIDTFGGATNVWSINPTDAGLPSHVATLEPQPSLSTVNWAVAASSSDINTLIVGYNGSATAASIRAYSLPSGTLINEVTSLGHFAHTSFYRPVAGQLAVAMADSEQRPTIVLYSVSADGIKEMRRLSPDPDFTAAPGIENLAPLHLTDSGALLTASTAIPSSTLTLMVESDSDQKKVQLPASMEADFLYPTSLARISPSSIAIAVAESHSSADFQPVVAGCTIHGLDLSPLALQWRMSIKHGVNRLTHHPDLHILAATGTRYSLNVSEPRSTPVITLLDDKTGAIIKEAEVRVLAMDQLKAFSCSASDHLVLVLNNGRLMVITLQEVLKNGLPHKDGVLMTEPSPTAPEPYNTKARKAGEGWRWVDHVVVGPRRIFVFPLRGPEFYVLGY